MLCARCRVRQKNTHILRIETNYEKLLGINVINLSVHARQVDGFSFAPEVVGANDHMKSSYWMVDDGKQNGITLKMKNGSGFICVACECLCFKRALLFRSAAA